MITYQPGTNEDDPEDGTEKEGLRVRFREPEGTPERGDNNTEGAEQTSQDEVTVGASYMAGTVEGKLHRMAAEKPIKEVIEYFNKWVESGASEAFSQQVLHSVNPMPLMAMHNTSGQFLQLFHSTAMYTGENFVENDPEKGIITFVTDRTEDEEPAAATIQRAALKSNMRRRLPKDLEMLTGLAEGDGKKL